MDTRRIRKPASLLLAVALAAAGFVVAVDVTDAGAVSTPAVVSWGPNGSGQLGDGTQTSRPAPVVGQPGAGSPGLAKVSAGFDMSVAVTDAGGVMAWGGNGWGVSGPVVSPFRTTIPTAVTLPAGVTVTQAVVGNSHALALTTDGKVLAWGTELQGELGDGGAAGAFQTRVVPASVAIPGDPVIVDVAAGTSVSLAVTAGGQVWAWGNNMNGQIGNGTTASVSSPTLVSVPGGEQVTHVAVADRTVVASTASGRVLTWGQGNNGELGTGGGAVNAQRTPVFANVPAGTAVDVGSGYLWSFAITSTGGALAWGLNTQGQLGDGTTISRSAPVPVQLPAGAVVTDLVGGNQSSVALLADGRVLTFGSSANGSLGRTTSTSANPVPTAVTLPSGFVARSVGMGTSHVVVGGEQDGPPAITITSPADGAVLEAGSTVVADYDCTDDQGVPSCVGTVADQTALDTLTLGPAALSVSSTDSAGATTTASASYTVVDSTEPTVTISVPADGASFELGSAVAADFTCADLFLASCEGTVADGASIDTSSTGAKTFRVAGEDTSGNARVVTYDYTVTDQVSPEVVIHRPVAGEVIEAGSSVAADYRCNDAGLTSCVGTVADGAGIDTTSPGPRSFSVTGRDASGNETTADAPYSVVDTTDPTVAVSSPVAGVTYAPGSTVVADFSCADLLLESCVGTVADGAALDTTVPGAKTFVVTGIDTSGNTTVRTIAYAVAPGAPTTLTVAPILLQGWPLRVTIGSVSARLTGPGGAALVGAPVVFRLGATVLCTGTTNATGSASCAPSLVLSILLIAGGKVDAAYAGSVTHLPSSGSGRLIG